jgi:adenosylcobinamide-GDP ribazoletransferase
LGAAVAGTVSGWVVSSCWLGALALLTGALVLSGRSWWLGPLAAVVTVLTVALVLVRARSRFGGITGDVIGAGVELAFLALLLVVSV